MTSKACTIIQKYPDIQDMTSVHASSLNCRWEVRYKDYVGKTWDILLSNSKATLPIKRGEHLLWLEWGSRPGEDLQGFTVGGMVREESLKAGKWKQFMPQKVHLHLSEFSEPGVMVPTLYFDVPENHAVLGIVATWHGEKRVYIVTTQPPRGMVWHKNGWPVLVPYPQG